MSNKRGIKPRKKHKHVLHGTGSFVKIGEAFTAIRDPNKHNKHNKPIDLAALMEKPTPWPWEELHFKV